MHTNFQRSLVSLAILSLAFGCGSDKKTNPDPQPLSVSGFVVKGPIEGASVAIRTIGVGGAPGSVVSGPFTTLADGSWSGTISDGADRQFLVVANGGSYDDEATGLTVDLRSQQQLVGYLDTSASTVAVVTPVTHAMWLGTRSQMLNGMTARAAWAERVTGFDDLLFDPVVTVPRGDGTLPERRYAAWLGGFSAMANADAFDEFEGVNAFDIVSALAEDLADGRLDGRGVGDSNVEIDGTQIPAMDESGVTALVDAAEEAAGDTGLWGVVEIDPPVVLADCEEALAAAHTELENVLFEEINAEDPQYPDEVDFSGVKALYEQLLTCGPSDANARLEAHLALALLEIATLSTDPDVNAAFDEWKAYLDEFVPFETDAPVLAGFGPLTLGKGNGEFSLSAGFAPRSVLALVRMARFGAVPQVSTVQAVLENKVLPAATRALEHIDEVLAAEGFEFEISPTMQGDENELPLIADRTDFLATRAALYGLRAGCRAAVSYEVSMPAYDAANIVAALDQSTGTWLRLRTGGAANMAAVPSDLIAAAQDLNDAILSLFAEIDSNDNQDDEVIKIGPDLPSRSKIEEFRTDELPRIIRSLQGPTEETYDWDFDESTPRVALEVDLNHFFTNAAPDFKLLAPPYEISTELVPYEQNWIYDPPSTDQVTVQVPEGGIYSSVYCQIRYYRSGPGWEDCYAEENWLASALRSVRDAKVEEVRSIPGWAGDVSVTVYFAGGPLDAGTQSIEVALDVSYSVTDRWVAIPVVTFEADTYSEWAAAWPDPSMHGLFPNPPSSTQMLTIFGMAEENWGKVLRLDWVDGFELTYPGLRAGPARTQ